MNGQGSLQSIETELRAAVASGAYDKAEALVREWRKEFEATLHYPGLSHANKLELTARGWELMRWAVRAVRAGRADALGRLNQLPRAGGYGQRAAPRPTVVQCFG